MQPQPSGLRRIAHLETHPWRLDHTGVTHLPSRLGVERRHIQHDDTMSTFIDVLDALSFTQQRQHTGSRGQRLVANEHCRLVHARITQTFRFKLTRTTRTFALCLHRTLETGLIDPQPALTGDVGGQIQRKAVGIVELEHRVTVKSIADEGLDILLEDTHADIQRSGKLFLLEQQNPFDLRSLFMQLGIGIPHHISQRCDQPVKESLAHAELVTMSTGAAQYASQHVTTTFVRRQHSVSNQECTGTDVIGNHP